MKFLLVLLLSGCIEPGERKPLTIYRMTAKLTVNGKTKYGTLVATKSSKYQIKARFYRKSEVIKVSSCHREWVSQDADNDISYSYIPVRGIENKGYCPIEIGGFDTKGQHTWGYIDFVDDETLPGIIGCDGESSAYIGVSVCQSKAGLIQKIEFLKKVDVYPLESCEPPKFHDGKLWTFKIARGKCGYVFSNPKGEIHRLTTIGYDEVMIR